jgi:hypothetical protein
MKQEQMHGYDQMDMEENEGEEDEEDPMDL